MSRQPSRELVVGVLACRGFTNVAQTTIDDLVAAVADSWDLSRQVNADLVHLTETVDNGERHA